MATVAEVQEACASVRAPLMRQARARAWLCVCMCECEGAIDATGASQGLVVCVHV